MQRKALKEIQQINNNTKFYPFDKGLEFFVLSEANAIKKIEEQLGKAKIIDEDPTQQYTSKMRKYLCQLTFSPVILSLDLSLKP